ncbi:hypothetical protein HYS95_00415 [Candidatus Daviesbacteria bacterium]|nr:hypothetical protein [Candidatus Daviesbacteria bacterium]
MIKSIALLFVLSFWLLALPAEALAATLSLSPSSGTLNRGCPVSLDVIVDTQGAQTDGTDAILVYDATRFTASSITPGTIYPDFPGNNINETSGKITISGLASVSTPFTGKGALAKINLTVKDEAPTGSTKIQFDFDPNDKGKTTDSNIVERTTVADVLNAVTDGNYIIGTGACGSQPVATTAPKPIGGEGTPSGQPKTIDDLVDKDGKGPGTPQLTYTIAIIGSVLTVLGILGLALL